MNDKGGAAASDRAALHQAATLADEQPVAGNRGSCAVVLCNVNGPAGGTNPPSCIQAVVILILHNHLPLAFEAHLARIRRHMCPKTSARSLRYDFDLHCPHHVHPEGMLQLPSPAWLGSSLTSEPPKSRTSSCARSRTASVRCSFFPFASRSVANPRSLSCFPKTAGSIVESSPRRRSIPRRSSRGLRHRRFHRAIHGRRPARPRRRSHLNLSICRREVPRPPLAAGQSLWPAIPNRPASPQRACGHDRAAPV